MAFYAKGSQAWAGETEGAGSGLAVRGQRPNSPCDQRLLSAAGVYRQPRQTMNNFISIQEKKKKKGTLVPGNHFWTRQILVVIPSLSPVVQLFVDEG